MIVLQKQYKSKGLSKSNNLEGDRETGNKNEDVVTVVLTVGVWLFTEEAGEFGLVEIDELGVVFILVVVVVVLEREDGEL